MTVASSPTSLANGADGTAKHSLHNDPRDYTTAAPWLNFAAGSWTTSFYVKIYNDLIVEGNESLGLSLLSPSAGYSSPATASLTTVRPP